MHEAYIHVLHVLAQSRPQMKAACIARAMAKPFHHRKHAHVSKDSTTSTCQPHFQSISPASHHVHEAYIHVLHVLAQARPQNAAASIARAMAKPSTGYTLTCPRIQTQVLASRYFRAFRQPATMCTRHIYMCCMFWRIHGLRMQQQA